MAPRPKVIRLAAVALAAVVIATVASAVVFPQGQSFTPAAAGTVSTGYVPQPGDTVHLTGFTLDYSTLTGASTTLYILASAPAVQGDITANAVATSSSFSDAGNFRTFIFTSNYNFTANNTYYAFLPTSTSNLIDSASNPYGGGIEYNGALGAASTRDLIFSATFVNAIPEPSAYAALAGLGALGLVALRRRRV